MICLAFAPMRAKTGSDEMADLALINGRLWTGEGQSSFVEAVAVRGNMIVKTGRTAEIKQMVDQRTQVIDLGGRLVTAGFNDAHVHFLGGSLSLSEVDLNGAGTVAQMLTRIAAYAKKHPEAPWIKGRGWEYTKFPGGLPTKSYLDAIIRDRPVFLSAYDGHSAWVNSKALELAGVTDQTKFEGYGEIVRNPAGEATGALKEGAQSLVRSLIPEPTREQKLEALRRGMKMASSLGLTSIQNASGSPEELELYDELLKLNQLTLRVSVAFSVGERTKPFDLDRYVKLKEKYQSNQMLRAGSVKIMLDGVIESHTAAMLEPYSDLPANTGAPLGELAIPTDVYRKLVARFDERGFQIYTHAIGDRAVREALNGYESAQNANKRYQARHRIEHIETVSPEDIPRFARIGVMASMEPIHADPGTVDVWVRAVGTARLPFSFPWSAMLKHGARLVFSSDWPAAISIDPIRGLHNAVNRRTIDGQPPKGWVPEQRISMTQALQAYTQAGAYSSFEENLKGRIAPGMLADLIVFSQDLFKIDQIKIHETRVVMTVFDGKVVYQREN